ncbi:MAG: M23 family metallopeptidase [Spirochaetales bacterium]|jgi:murein DD-endopeptidase MepM/ murein hydrolase activator NlpD|nr:M23 family metallopeptidase [Exilispira sp.]NMC68090.1 M23 family metallopeptidase [Spirochaetales bacterium]
MKAKSILIISFSILVLSTFISLNNDDFPFFSKPLIEDFLYKEFISEISYNYGCHSSGKFLPLRFAYYKPEKYDDLYRIANYFQLSVDTIASVNNLFSQYLFDTEDTYLIPNCEGIFIDNDKDNILEKITKNYGISSSSILFVNHLKNESEIKKLEKIFVPLAHFSKEEKILFLGSLFRDPLRGKGVLSSSFGVRIDPFSHKSTFHGGVDIAVPIGTNVYPAMPGKVIFTGFKKDYGNLVIIEHGYGYETYYGHLSKILIQIQDKVDFDKIIALTGNTGKTTGPHLHFEIRFNKKRVNPSNLLLFFNH